MKRSHGIGNFPPRDDARKVEDDHCSENCMPPLRDVSKHQEVGDDLGDDHTQDGSLEPK